MRKLIRALPFVLFWAHLSGCGGDSDATHESAIDNAIAIMESTMGPLIEPNLRMRSLALVHQKILNAAVLHSGAQFVGRTLVLVTKDGEYLFEDSRSEAPSNGTRFMLYRTDDGGLVEPLDKWGWVDIKWSQGESLEIAISGTADGLEFLTFTGEGTPQVILSDQLWTVEWVANTELAAGALSVTGVVYWPGAEAVQFEYNRTAEYFGEPVRGQISAINEWAVPTASGRAYYYGRTFYGSFDSDNYGMFLLDLDDGRRLDFSIVTLRGHFSLPWEVMIDGEPVDDVLVGRGTLFASVVDKCLSQLAIRKTNIQELMAPAMFPLIVALQ